MKNKKDALGRYMDHHQRQEIAVDWDQRHGIHQENRVQSPEITLEKDQRYGIHQENRVQKLLSTRISGMAFIKRAESINCCQLGSAAWYSSRAQNQ
jgi:hypothetical protein